VSEELRSILLGTAGLSAAALAAILLTLTRGGISSSGAELRASVRLAAIAVLLQAAHFAEEVATGFPELFPEQLGLTPWSRGFFVSFNLFWLIVWGFGVLGLAARRRPALAALWFLAIAGFVNGLAHPVLSARVGGYFPGLITSPFLGVVGLLLLRRLALLTRGRGSPREV